MTLQDMSIGLSIGGAILATASMAMLLPTGSLAQPAGAPVVPPTVVPTDVTNLPLIDGLPLGPVDMPRLDPTSAIKRLSQSSFPRVEQARDEDSGIIIEPKKGAKFERSSTAFILLTSGTIFVSVRKPANFAIVATPDGMVAVASDGDIIVSFEKGLLKVMNLSAFGERVKVQVHEAAVRARIVGGDNPGTDNPGTNKTGTDKGAAYNGGGSGKSYGEAGTKGFVMAVKIAHELVVSDGPLSRADLNPNDGIARRRSAVFENDRMAVSEFSLESVLNDCDFISSLNQNNLDPRERRVLANLAKMAAVLKYVNGQGGFVAGGKQY